MARRVAHDHVLHGVSRSDPYAWMSPVDGEHPQELVDHLAAERAWCDLATTHLDSLTSVLRSEMVARVPERRRSGTWSRMRFSYYTWDARNRDYGVIWRESRHDSASGATKSRQIAVPDDDFVGVADPAQDAEVVLDINSLDAGTGYLDLGLTIVSPSEDLLAYSVDTSGDEVFALRFRDLRSGADLPDVVEGTGYTGAWLSDSSGFLYTVFDDSWRQERVRLHRLGTPPSDDVDVLVEPDRRFEVTVRRCRSEQAIVVLAESRDTSESWYVDPSGVDLRARSLGGRRGGVEYRAEHVRDSGFLLVTDDEAVEFRLVSCPLPPAGGQDHTSWVEERAEDPAERFERVDAFGDAVVATFRRGGDRMLRVLPIGDLAGAGIEVHSRFTGGEIRLARNTWYDAASVAIIDESHVNPVVHAEVALATGAVTDSHRDGAGDHDPSAYVTEVRSFSSVGGVEVPATIVRHRETPLDGSAPALIWAYGAYEYSWEREWEEKWASFLDRGVVLVHAHIRGGGECGRHWWLDGRLTAKQHTFDDLLAVADGVAEAGLVDPTRIATRGLSAGGLLQGAVFSQRPDRWRAVLAEVPFVDVITSMSDDSLPLTVNEWDEWGDPRVREHFDAMLAYSPYDNPPPAGGRPDLMVTGAVHDTRVLVHEPAKWVARLRETDPDWARQCLFRVELGTGSHVGPSGRLDHLAYEAAVAAWLLDRLEVRR
ncbi:S9 family peptidase [Nocardioides agariphilus]|uniref:S9 family peptidase n=1 Tax=Nocardioides agariphilus TaxID=433664 RepID=A0A930VRC6_9ACTN|nr:S9 family peptidase [Nocardioides agariphilus]